MGSLPKGKKKNIPRSTKEMSKEMLQETLKKKKECNAKALQIVELLCNDFVEEGVFLKNLEFINQTHLEDVIIERAITKLCGYPICPKKLENVPTKKYHISTRYNKVFDITERKNFCSSECYKAAMHVKNQLLTSPLWFRDQEVIPKFTLLKCSSSSMGNEVVFCSNVKLDETSDENTKSEKNEEKKYDHFEDEKTEVNSKLKQSVDNEIAVNEKNDCSCKDEDIGDRDQKSIQNDVNDLCDTKKKDDPFKKVNIEEEKNIQTDNKFKVNPYKNVQKSGKTDKRNEQEVVTDSVSKVEKSINEWFNLNSMIFLLGENKAKERLSDKTEEIKEAVKSMTLSSGYSERVDRMINLFSLLDIHLSDAESVKRDLKPLPNYSIIKEEGKKLEVKVRSFYKGQLEIDADLLSSEKESHESKETEEESEIYLPLVDANAQNALRRRIVLDRLNRIIPELLRTFTADFPLEMSEVRSLVSNFTLKADNITFKPAEWYLVGIIIIKLLSFRIKHLENLLSSENAKKQLTLYLTSLQLQPDYLENIVNWLMNSDSIVQKLNASG